jgi:hypothetical protein
MLLYRFIHKGRCKTYMYLGMIRLTALKVQVVLDGWPKYRVIRLDSVAPRYIMRFSLLLRATFLLVTHA